MQTLLLGLVAASALRITGAVGRKPEDKDAPPAAYTASGARRAGPAVNITPRPTSAAGVMLEQLLADKVKPDDAVSTVMKRHVLKARASDSVDTVLTYFDSVTGIVVVADDDPDAIIGVFSRRDAAKAQRKDTISVWMTSPALTIDADTRIVECAALMLKHEVHRLPVVNAAGACPALWILRGLPACAYACVLPQGRWWASSHALMCSTLYCRSIPLWGVK